MTDAQEFQAQPPSARERFGKTLQERAEKIKTVRNDVYTVKYWQLAFNFVIGVSAIVLLIVSMTVDSTPCLISAICCAVVVVVFNLIIRAVAPMSFLQYTAIVGDKRYCFQILSKNESLFSDGENAVEYNRMEYVKTDGVRFPQYRFDFFKDMDVDVRIGKPDREIFKGRATFEGKTYKCKIVFKSGVPYYGSFGGARIKYFDVNDTKEKFVVPEGLRKAAEAFDVPFPKLAGIRTLDPYSTANAAKQ